MEMGFQTDNFSNREMGNIVGQKSRVIRFSVCLSELLSFNTTLYLRKENTKPTGLYNSQVPEQQGRDYLVPMHLTPGL